MNVSNVNKLLVKRAPSKTLVVRFNLFCFAIFLIVYATLLLRLPSSVYFDSAASLVGCSLRECHHKAEKGIQIKGVLEELPKPKSWKPKANRTKIEVPNFLGEKIGKEMKIGMVNMNEDDDISEWNIHGEIIPINFDKVSQFFNWKDLFPEWIDEEEESKVPTCPELPMPEFATYENMDIIVAKLPCKYPEEGWAREVLRLQVHLMVANMVVKKGKKDWKRKSRVIFWSKCRPMLEIFRCDDLVNHEGDWWFFEVDVKRLEQKVSLPVGSCNLALPLWEQGIDKMEQNVRSKTRAKHEAYATILHSSERYVCGAITLAQSLLKTGTKRDLILLIDSSISVRKRHALKGAGWKIRTITRIGNPRGKNGTYNKYNYTKIRLWQLSDYEKIIFIDSDILVLRNLDILFNFPQMSATGNARSIFNAGMMVIEPSDCTFSVLMNLRHDIVSYNGGDQGFLNEIFVWWHRLPNRVNYLKNFWANTTVEASVKNGLFSADPPKLYAIHYLGLKPWHCYRDYDCNWDVVDQRVYASDVAHQRWWNFHDRMDKNLQSFCRLTRQRRTELNWERRRSSNMGSLDYQWKVKVIDPRNSDSHLMD